MFGIPLESLLRVDQFALITGGSPRHTLLSCLVPRVLGYAQRSFWTSLTDVFRQRNTPAWCWPLHPARVRTFKILLRGRDGRLLPTTLEETKSGTSPAVSPGLLLLTFMTMHLFQFRFTDVVVAKTSEGK